MATQFEQEEEGVLRFIRNRWAAFVHDLLWIPIAIWAAYLLRFNFDIPSRFVDGMLWLTVAMVPVQSLCYWLFGLYRGIWRYASIPDLMRILKAVGLGALALASIALAMRSHFVVPRSVPPLFPILLLMGLAGSRFFYRWFKDRGTLALTSGQGLRSVVIGAGRAGELLVRDLLRNSAYSPICFLDDDPKKRGWEIHGVRVKGRISDLERIIQEWQVETVFLTISFPKRHLVQKVVTVCAEAKIPCRILPSMQELAGGLVEVSRLRAVMLEDLLGREPVALDDALIEAAISGKRVLVTGGGGSIGSELCRQVAGLGPLELVIYEHGEFNLYRILEELRRRFPKLPLRPVLGDVKDAERVEMVFSGYQPQVVFHAAAYKHVPLVEENPAEGVRNNVIGTRTVANAAMRWGCDRMVLISTDKAVKPTNVMGASKRVAEVYCQNLSARSPTRFITVRFGNVLDSAGSVVPLFREQIAAGGPVTVTHPEITRYFMTIPEAVGLVLQAGSMGEGGEIFVLDMGEPVKVRELAEQMIRLSGLEPEVDIPIHYIGLRPGEKLFEELFHESEQLKGTHHPKIMLANSRHVDWDWLCTELSQLDEVARVRDIPKLLDCIRHIVPEFTPDQSHTVAE